MEQNTATKIKDNTLTGMYLVNPILAAALYLGGKKREASYVLGAFGLLGAANLIARNEERKAKMMEYSKDITAPSSVIQSKAILKPELNLV